MQLRSLLLCCLLVTAAVPAWAEPVDSVQVRITDNGGTSGVLLDRMSRSMQVVAEQLFVDKDSVSINAARGDYERLLAEVGDRVLTGYQMQSVSVNAGAVTNINIQVAPWSAAVDDAFVDLQFSGVEPGTAEWLQQRLPQLQNRIENIIKGSSVDASDWAGGILRRLVRSEVEEKLPEFKAAVDVVREDERTVVQVVIYPVGQLVQNVDYSMASESIPNLLLLDLKQRYAQKADALRGLPVEYVKRHQAELENLLLTDLQNEKSVKLHNLAPAVKLVPGGTLGVEINMGSDKYKIWFEGYGDIGRNDNNISGRAHIGKFISEQDEIFGEAGVTLDEVDWDFSAGYARHWGKATLSYMRRGPDGQNVYRGEYDFTNKWRLRTEYFSGTDTTEIAVRYRIHEFLSAEYVYSNDKPYFRIVGNL